MKNVLNYNPLYEECKTSPQLFSVTFGFCLKLQFSTVNPGYGFVSQKQTFGICQTGQIPFLLTK